MKSPRNCCTLWTFRSRPISSKAAQPPRSLNTPSAPTLTWSYSAVTVQGGLSDWYTSSVAQKVIQRVGISVLLVRAWRPEASCEPAHWGEQRYHRILAPLDGSTRAECVLPIATALAERADALWLVHVVPRPELFQRLPLTTDEEALLEQIGKRNQQQAEHYFEQLQARLLPAPAPHHSCQSQRCYHAASLCCRRADRSGAALRPWLFRTGSMAVWQPGAELYSTMARPRS